MDTFTCKRGDFVAVIHCFDKRIFERLISIISLTLSSMVVVPPPDNLLRILLFLALHGSWQGDGEHLEVAFELVSDLLLSLLLTIFVSTRPSLEKL